MKKYKGFLISGYIITWVIELFVRITAEINNIPSRIPNFLKPVTEVFRLFFLAHFISSDDGTDDNKTLHFLEFFILSSDRGKRISKNTTAASGFPVWITQILSGICAAHFISCRRDKFLNRGKKKDRVIYKPKELRKNNEKTV